MSEGNPYALPVIPGELIESDEPLFLASPEWRAWAYNALVLDGPLVNPDHFHLSGADVQFLLTNVENFEKGKQILGTAQMGAPTGKAWSKARAERFLLDRFKEIPDFLIILDATFLAGARPLEALAVTDHEFYHCGVKRKRDGEIQYGRDDRPKFAIREHDVQEFTGVARRWGAWNDDLKAFQEALWWGPTIGQVTIDGLCGCGAKFA